MAEEKKTVKAATAAWLHEEPSPASKIVGEVAEGQEIVLIKKGKDWTHVEGGYIKTRHLV